MTRYLAGLAALAALVACGDGNPFTDNSGGTTSTAADIPAAIAGDLDSINFNAATNTLTVTGLNQDGSPVANAYSPADMTAGVGIDVNGYTAFTAQNDPLGRHATALVASRTGVQAGVVVTGGQFNKIFGGSFYSRSGTYSEPVLSPGDFDVTYYGNYAGLLNGPGPDTNLLPVGAGVDPNVDRPVQAAFVRGLMFVNVDLADRSVEGEIYNRTGVFRDTTLPSGRGFLGLPDIVLVEGTLDDGGNFTGNLEVDGNVGTNIGEFAGVIGGPGGNALAGGLKMEDFDTTIDNEIEYGVFVLDLCTPTDTDPICQNAN